MHGSRTPRKVGSGPSPGHFVLIFSLPSVFMGVSGTTELLSDGKTPPHLHIPNAGNSRSGRGLGRVPESEPYQIAGLCPQV